MIRLSSLQEEIHDIVLFLIFSVHEHFILEFRN